VHCDESFIIDPELVLHLLPGNLHCHKQLSIP
jgi:hypothetical protein